MNKMQLLLPSLCLNYGFPIDYWPSLCSHALIQSPGAVSSELPTRPFQ